MFHNVHRLSCDKEEHKIMFRCQIIIIKNNNNTCVYNSIYSTAIPKTFWALIMSLHSLPVQTSITRQAQSSWSAGHLTTALPWLHGSVAASRCGVSLELTLSALWERTLRRWTHTHIHSYTLNLMQIHSTFFMSLYLCVLPSGIVLMVPRRTPLKSALW